MNAPEQLCKADRRWVLHDLFYWNRFLVRVAIRIAIGTRNTCLPSERMVGESSSISMCCLHAGVAGHGGMRGGQSQAPVLTLLAFNEWYNNKRISMEPYKGNIIGPAYGEDNRAFYARTGSKRSTRMVVVGGHDPYEAQPAKIL